MQYHWSIIKMSKYNGEGHLPPSLPPPNPLSPIRVYIIYYYYIYYIYYIL